MPLTAGATVAVFRTEVVLGFAVVFDLALTFAFGFGVEDFVVLSGLGVEAFVNAIVERCRLSAP